MTQLPACAVCGSAARPPFRPPPAELAPDLDGRPGEPTRSTLPKWIATCRRCGASGPDLSRLPDGTADVVRGAAYQALRVPGPDKPALRWALVCSALDRRAEAAEATLQAAWALDDAASGPGAAPSDPAPPCPTSSGPMSSGQASLSATQPGLADAATLRRRAVSLWGPPQGTEDALRQVDILRRAGDFAGASVLADALDSAPLDENSAAILAFQRARIADGDAGRQLLSSALRPPARRPHVTHGTQAQASGFWRRLLGR